MAHSFNLKDNLNKKNKIDYSLIMMIVFIFIAVVCMIIYFIMSNQNNNKYIEKTNENKNYVFSAKKEKNTYQDGTHFRAPEINLKGEKYTKINKEISSLYKTIIKNVDSSFDYQYNVSKDILSLVVRYSYYPNTSDKQIIYFKTYNIDLKNDKILKNSEILNMYNLTSKKIETFMEAKFKSYYTDLINQKYYTKKECDYECFLNNRGITKKYLNNISYYIDDGSLTLFKYYYRYSSYEEELYFTDDSFQFLIKK